MNDKIINIMLNRLTAIEQKLDMLTTTVVNGDTDTGTACVKNSIDIADTQIAACELSEDVDTRITDIEIALCELSEQ